MDNNIPTTIEDVIRLAKFQNNRLTSLEVSHHFGVSLRSTAAFMANLTRKGLVEQDEPSKTDSGHSRWVLTTKAGTKTPSQRARVKVLHKRVPVDANLTLDKWEAMYQTKNLESSLKKAYLSLGVLRGDEIIKNLRSQLGV